MDDNLDLLGSVIAQFRRDKKLTSKKLAEMAGITPSLLSQIEKGSAKPSLSTLQALAAALQQPIFSFFAPIKDNPHSDYIRRAAQQGSYTFSRNDENGNTLVDCQWELLSPGIGYSTEVLKVLLPPKGGRNLPNSTHMGEEIAYVTRGSVELYLSDRTIHLDAGDSIRILPYIMHSWFNNTNEDVEIIMAVSVSS